MGHGAESNGDDGWDYPDGDDGIKGGCDRSAGWRGGMVAGSGSAMAPEEEADCCGGCFVSGSDDRCARDDGQTIGSLFT